MKCPKCGSANTAGAKYCRKCQTPLPKSNARRYCIRCSRYYPPGTQYCAKCQSELTDRPYHSRLPWIIGGIAAAVIAGTMLVSGFLIAPARDFEDAVAQQDAQRLALVCREHRGLLDSGKHRQTYLDFMESRVDAYLQEEISYSEAIRDFSYFDQINSHMVNDEPREAAAQELNRIEKLHAGREQFADAAKAAREQQYEAAEAGFRAVKKDDPLYYPLAQQQLSMIVSEKTGILSDAEEQRSHADFDGSIETLTQGLEQFAYDEVYCRKYRYAIVETIVAQCDALTQENCWFSAGDRQGAFELLNSYLLNPDYADQKILRAKLQEVAQESVTYELAAAESALGLGETSPVLNRIADNIAKASFRDASIRSSKVYAMKICSEDAGVRSLLGDRVLGEQAEAVLIGESVMSAADFAAKARAKVDAYRDKPWIAAGLGRYYSEKERKFTWTVMLLYETIEAEEE